MKLSLLWIGKTKDRRIAELIDDYLHRLSRYAKYDLLELREARSTTHPAVVVETEAKSILGAIASGANKVALDERGRQFSSTALARMLEQWQVDGMREVAFVIGGHFG